MENEFHKHLSDPSLSPAHKALISLKESGKKTPLSCPTSPPTPKFIYVSKTCNQIPDTSGDVRENVSNLECCEDSFDVESRPEDEESLSGFRSDYPSPLRSRKQSSPSRVMSHFAGTVAKRDFKSIMNSMNNFLKHSAGRKWAYHEWFYSNIDRALLLGENDFEKCLQQQFARLRTRMLTKVQWTIVRRLMGKPRRCSPAFFTEERLSLEAKRKKIRFLHQLKGTEQVSDVSQFIDMPDEISMPIVIGTKVTAKVHSDGNGLRLFTGTVDAVDTLVNHYRVVFDRDGVGTQSIPDIDVASALYETMNWQLFIAKERPKIAGPTLSPTNATISPVLVLSDSAMPGSSTPARVHLKDVLSCDVTATYGGFPIKFLLLIVKLSKILKHKRNLVDQITDMNSLVERRRSFRQLIGPGFQKKYASIVLDLEKLNLTMQSTLEGIQCFVSDLAPDLSLFDQPCALRQQCDEDARAIVESNQRCVSSEKLLDLVRKLTSLMLQVKRFAEHDMRGHELLAIDAAVQELKAGLYHTNLETFVDQVETSMAFIKNSLAQRNTLEPFANSLLCSPVVSSPICSDLVDDFG